MVSFEFADFGFVGCMRANWAGPGAEAQTGVSVPLFVR
jgi:hypothetical protein